MASLYLEFGQDFALNANGGLAIAQQWDETRQFFERAMFTNPTTTMPDGSPVIADCLFDPTFGQALSLKIGQNATGNWFKDVQRGAIAAAQFAPGVNPGVPPVVTLQQVQDHTFLLQVTVTLSSGQTGTLSYQVRG